MKRTRHQQGINGIDNGINNGINNGVDIGAAVARLERAYGFSRD